MWDYEDGSVDIIRKQKFILTGLDAKLEKFEVISINRASSTDLFLAPRAIHHILSCP